MQQDGYTMITWFNYTKQVCLTSTYLVGFGPYATYVSSYQADTSLPFRLEP